MTSSVDLSLVGLSVLFDEVEPMSLVLTAIKLSVAVFFVADVGDDDPRDWVTSSPQDRGFFTVEVVRHDSSPVVEDESTLDVGMSDSVKTSDVNASSEHIEELDALSDDLDGGLDAGLGLLDESLIPDELLEPLPLLVLDDPELGLE